MVAALRQDGAVAVVFRRGNDIDDQVQILRDSMEAAYENGNAKAKASAKASKSKTRTIKHTAAK